MGIDIDEMAVGAGYGILPNATSVNVEFGTEADQYFPSVFGFSVKMKDPMVTMQMAVADADGNGVMNSNEVLTYTLTGGNVGSGTAYNTYVVDSLPVNTTYVANSLKINIAPGITNPITQTDAAGDDFAFKGTNGTRSYVKYFIGTGATPASGGQIDPGGSYSVSFRVKGGLIPGAVTNSARVTSGSQAGDIFTDDASVLIAPLAGGPLAAKLISFDAVLIGDKQGLLKWSTENEMQNDHFEIERSEDGVQFIKLGTTAGSGSTSTAHNYNYTDNINTLANVVYYRLKVVSIDGHFGYTKIVALRLRGSVNDITAYPNPFDDNIKISMVAEADVTAIFRIISFDGKEMMRRNIILEKGENLVVLKDLQYMAAGTYLLEVNTGTQKAVKKIVKK